MFIRLSSRRLRGRKRELVRRAIWNVFWNLRPPPTYLILSLFPRFVNETFVITWGVLCKISPPPSSILPSTAVYVYKKGQRNWRWHWIVQVPLTSLTHVGLCAGCERCAAVPLVYCIASSVEKNQKLIKRLPFNLSLTSCPLFFFPRDWGREQWTYPTTKRLLSL